MDRNFVKPIRIYSFGEYLLIILNVSSMYLFKYLNGSSTNTEQGTLYLRNQAKCIKMLLQQYRYRMTIAIVMVFHIICLRRQVRRRLTFLLLLLKYYCSIKSVTYRHRHWSANIVLTLNSLDINGSWHKLRFKRQHLWLLNEALRLPGELQLDNGSYTSKEEMLIILYNNKMNSIE